MYKGVNLGGVICGFWLADIVTKRSPYTQRETTTTTRLLSVQTLSLIYSANIFIQCEKTLVDEITKSKRQQNILKESVTNIPNLHSKSHFSYKDHCLFCGKEVQKCKLKGNDVFPVRTDDFQRRIEQVCNDRDDEWAPEVRGRLECISDLHAADALYHQTCSVNFRTSKKVPEAFSPDPKAKENNYHGRPAAYGEQFKKKMNCILSQRARG
ncbi:unnamed protein product [Mytilus coruscus]|uniref:Uncharacterized protein n=1 Tax=Mytilus coruscus TaxID=42192 RepID=A0A6J8ARQ1_MYTCO|nr:unnamed protein product [Mytilus coruscus]